MDRCLCSALIGGCRRRFPLCLEFELADWFMCYVIFSVWHSGTAAAFFTEGRVRLWHKWRWRWYLWTDACDQHWLGDAGEGSHCVWSLNWLIGSCVTSFLVCGHTLGQLLPFSQRAVLGCGISGDEDGTYGQMLVLSTDWGMQEKVPIVFGFYISWLVHVFHHF